MGRHEWFPLQIEAWKNDPFIRSLPLEARAFYLELLLLAWDEVGIKAEWIENPTWLARGIGISQRKFRSLWSQVRDKFEQLSDGNWSNKRLEFERFLSEERSKKSSKAAKDRWDAYAKSMLAGNAKPMPSTPQPHHNHNHSKKERATPQKKPGAAPLPFRAATALNLLAVAGRFVAAKPAGWQAIAIEKIIREWPEEQPWLTAGEWLAAGGDAWKSSVDTRCVGDFRAWLEQARVWDAAGRPAIGKGGKPDLRTPSPHSAFDRDEEF